MKKALILLFFLLPACLPWLSCGGASSSPGTRTSGIVYRAFISNSVGATGAVIVNAATDVRPNLPPIAAGNTPGMMVLTPNRAETLVFSGIGTPASDNQLTVISNASESAAGHVNLPGTTESFVVSPDSSTAFVAIPTAQVVGQSPGIVEAISLNTGAVTGQVNVPAVHYLSIDNDGNRIFAFSDNSDSVAVITPSQIGVGNAVTYVGGPGIFDRPVAAFFSSDDSTAYVVSCGAECGGTQASVQQFNLTTNRLVASVPACVPSGNLQNPCASPAAGSVALINASTMYLAGTPPLVGGVPQQPCTGQTTAAQSCGLLTIVNLSTMSVINTAPIVITDGYHNRIALGANGQLFIGAHTCTEVTPSISAPAGSEVRGCLSIYNTLTTAVGSAPAGGVLIPPANGDVTGIEPIAKRGAGVAQEAVYVVQGGAVNIYDTTTNALEYNPNDSKNPGQIGGLIGNFVDVKTVDF